ncbi:ankyrin repeat domain-containing protein, partial [Burkholderia gladioli]
MRTHDGWFCLNDEDPLFLALCGMGKIGPAVAAATAAGVVLHRVVIDHAGDGVERESVLDVALANGGSEVVRALLDGGLDPNAEDVHGSPPLFLLDRMTLEDVTLFIAAGARVNATDKTGRTPLFRACYDDVPTDVVKALLHAGAEVRVSDNDGQTPLYEATSNQNDPTDLVRLLLDAGADVNAADVEGRTPLLNLAMIDHPDCARLLLERGADPEQVVMHPMFPVRLTKDTHRLVWNAAVAAEKRTLNAVADGQAVGVVRAERRRL